MTKTLTLADFLLARIAEDERLAQAVVDTHEMWGWDAYVAQAGMYDEPASEYATRHNPERILAECAAKRLIVTNHCDAEARYDHEVTEDLWGQCLALDRVVRALASVYADHEDYRQEWKP